ncbi:MAG: radical SAM protein [bacterium]|nr:radical SAM protein [bacterium]
MELTAPAGMRVLLVNPAPEEIVQGGWYRMPLLGLGYLAAYLRRSGLEVRIADAKFERLGLDAILGRAREFRPALLGITAMTHEVVRASRIAAAAKEALPGLATVIGGPHVTALPAETLAEFPAFDAAVYGEGEETLLELAGAVRRGGGLSSIRGIAFRDGGAVRTTPPRPWREDIDGLPFPAWDLYPPAPEYQIFSSRGCPYRCSFCMRVLGDTVRSRSVGNVVREFEWVTETYRPREISFSDEVFTLDERRTAAVCDLLIEKGLHRRVRWFANARANCLSRPLYRKMREAGCVRVGVGIESGNPEILARIHKGITLEKARRMVRMCREEGLDTAAFFIIGHPGETRETIRQTIAFARELNPTSVAFGIMVPYPGTEIAALASRGEGGYRLISHDWSDYDKYFGGALELEEIGRRELERWQARAYIGFYLGNRRFLSLARFLASRRRSILHYIGRRLWKRR